MWENARLWDHWNHFSDMHLGYLGPVSCVLTSWASSGLTVGSGCSLMAAGWQVFFPSQVSSGLTAHLGGLQLLMTLRALFTDTAGNIPFMNGHKVTKSARHQLKSASWHSHFWKTHSQRWYTSLPHTLHWQKQAPWKTLDARKLVKIRSWCRTCQLWKRDQTSVYR